MSKLPKAAVFTWGNLLSMPVLRETLERDPERHILPPKAFRHILTDQGLSLSEPICHAKIGLEHLYANVRSIEEFEPLKTRFYTEREGDGQEPVSSWLARAREKENDDDHK